MSQLQYANAVKALITRPSHTCLDGEILILYNALDDPHRPGESDFPGGRLELGEDPYVGLKREITEELGEEMASAITIDYPLDIDHFKRADGQVVTLMFFKCELLKSVNLKLSTEHSFYMWCPLNEAEKYIHYTMIRSYKRLVAK